MTQHPSLKGSQGGGKFRSVLKRFEKIKELSNKDKWKEGENSAFGLPKIKRIKFKVKKVKAAAEETAEGAVAGAAGAEGAPAAGADAGKGDAKAKK